jgi:hypothetical protein
MPDEIEARLRREWENAVPVPLPDTARLVERAAPEHASRRAALAELDDARRLCAELRGHIEGNASEAVRATPGWTVREVIAHLASWAMRTRQELAATLEDAGGLEVIHFDRDGGPRMWNQREVDARAGRTVGMLFEELDDEWNRVAGLLATAPEGLVAEVVELPRTAGDPAAPWRMPLISMVIGACWHTRYHLQRLSRLI